MDPSPDTCGRRRVALLLFLHLLVPKAAADCPKPQGRVNIVLTNEALLMNDFPEGVDVTLECANGYVIESGSGSMTCVDEKWTEPDLTCKKKDCGTPKPQPNMSFNISAGTLFGAVMKVVCDKGFQVDGSSYKQCYASGWSGRAKCGIVTCDEPGEVTNGRSSWESQDKPKYGEIIQYVCNEGYALVGGNSAVCSETGEYDSLPPACEEEGEHFGAVDTNKDIGYMPVIVSVICVTLVVCIVALFLHKFLLKRKGSYDTREDLKPELLQFQNL
ncbi:complement decay-accelerating factor, GPI-anchored isoform X7 [Cyclopterus lumpus]|uniref:complement decay-accelerating factor, GPI-anchored isoform X7 n=1 Tax=Cyclopterus lumpus TaxID=8103 RepID=UPI00148725E4|nr:complement decay-accelerating factor, GPI-anchored isoform X7 [Cyclopterus lumpus]